MLSRRSFDRTNVRPVLLALLTLLATAGVVAAHGGPDSAAMQESNATTDGGLAADWQTTFGDDGAYDRIRQVIRVEDGYVAVGETRNGTGHAWLAGVDEDGSVEWRERYGVEGDTHATAVAEADDGYVISGYTNASADHTEAWVAKTDEEGATEWSRTYDLGLDAEDYGCWVTSTDDGYAVAAFGVPAGGEGDVDAAMLSLSEDGDVTWNRTVTGEGDDYLEHVTATDEGDLVFAGRSSSFGNDTDAWLISTDDEGEVRWNATFGGPGHDAAWTTMPTEDGFAVAGNAQPSSEAAMDPMLAMVGDEGDVHWRHVYDTEWEMSRAFVPDMGGFTLAATRHPSSAEGPSSGVALLAVNATGELQSVRTGAGQAADAAWGMTRAHGEGYVVAGQRGHREDSDAWIAALRIAPNGTGDAASHDGAMDDGQADAEDDGGDGGTMDEGPANGSDDTDDGSSQGLPGFGWLAAALGLFAVAGHRLAGD